MGGSHGSAYTVPVSSWASIAIVTVLVLVGVVVMVLGGLTVYQVHRVWIKLKGNSQERNNGRG